MYLISEGMVQTKSVSILLLFLLINGSMAADAEINNNVLFTTPGDTGANASTNVQQRFLTVHEVSYGSTISTYIWPKELCQVVVFCDYTGATENTGGATQYNKLNGTELCKNEKLVYFAYESSIQKIDASGKAEPKKYLPSPALKFEPGSDKKIKIQVAKDFDNVGLSKSVEESLEMELTGKLATLTSSPYCQIRLDDDGNMNVASFSTLLSNATNFPTAHLYAYSFFTTKVEKTEKIILDDVSTIANGDQLMSRDECNEFWDLPQYARKSDSNQVMLMQEYDYVYKKKPTTSFVLDVQDQSNQRGECTWIKVCLGKREKCTDAKRIVELLFHYGMFVPTDSDSAHAFGAPRKHLRRIQFEIKESDGKSIMIMKYALAGQKQEALLSHVMRLDDVFKLESGTLTLVQAKECNARLLNDWGSLQSSGHNAMKKKEQGITIRKCTVIAAKDK